jgi:hypothetical protein
MNVFTLKQQALAKVEEAYVRAEAHFGRKFTRVPVEFSAKQKVTAATLATLLLKLSSACHCLCLTAKRSSKTLPGTKQRI